MGILDRFRRINAGLNDRLLGKPEGGYGLYLNFINRQIRSGGVLLDLGAGAVSLLDYLPQLSQENVHLIAADAEWEGLARNRTPLKLVASADALPFPDGSVDLIAASCVFEHVEDPERVVSECFRVLKKGGALVFHTPNRRSYVAFVARITPLWFHRWFRQIQAGSTPEEVEVARTLYKMNTTSQLKKLLEGKFQPVSLDTYTGAPCYTLFMPPPVHLVFIFIHKLLREVGWLNRLFGEAVTGCYVKP